MSQFNSQHNSNNSNRQGQGQGFLSWSPPASSPVQSAGHKLAHIGLLVLGIVVVVVVVRFDWLPPDARIGGAIVALSLLGWAGITLARDIWEFRTQREFARLEIRYRQKQIGYEPPARPVRQGPVINYWTERKNAQTHYAAGQQDYPSAQSPSGTVADDEPGGGGVVVEGQARTTNARAGAAGGLWGAAVAAGRYLLDEPDEAKLTSYQAAQLELYKIGQTVGLGRAAWCGGQGYSYDAYRRLMERWVRWGLVVGRDPDKRKSGQLVPYRQALVLLKNVLVD